jgi:DNA-binding transcriptional regulator YiaG
MTDKEIRKLRDVLGRTQEQMAIILGTTSITVGRWERGESKPLPVFVSKLLKLKKFALDDRKRGKRDV